MRRRAVLATAAGLLALPGCTSFEGPFEEEGDDGRGGDDASDDGSTGAAGSIDVRVDGDAVDLTREAFRGDGDGPVSLEGGDEWRLRADEPPTVADALDGLPGFGYERDGWRALTVDGESYDEREAGTETAFSVDGDLVDPEAHELRDGDALRVEVTTRGAADREASAGGVDANGPIALTVDGDPYDLTRDRFQSEHVEDESLAFHLHHGDGQWYSEGDEHVTVGEGLDLLPEIAYERTDGAHVLQLPETTYDEREAGTELVVRVDDELVDPTAWEPADGDDVAVSVVTGQ